MNKILSLLVVLTLSVVINLQHFQNRNLYELRFLNVGQGDATFIKTPTPNSCRILIDGGPPQALTQKLRHLLPTLTKEIDLLILTHPHLDHMAGFNEILHRLKIKEVWLTGIAANNHDYNYFIEQIQNSPHNPNIKATYITKKFSKQICGIKFNVLWPNQSLIGKEIENLNNSSIVLQLEIKNKKILFTGDAEIEQEQDLLSQISAAQLESDILHAGHHGSKTSNSLELLSTVKPEYLIISAGENNTYNHPNFETIQKANLFNIKILRTDQLDANQDIIFFF